MLPAFTPEIERQLLELRLISLDSENFWAAFKVPNSPYLDYIWRQQWLPGHLTAAEMWRAAEAMCSSDTSLLLWQFSHRFLAEQLRLARQLAAQQVPCLVPYTDHLLQQAGAKGQLRTLMQQVNEAEEDVDFMLTRMANVLLNQVLLCVGMQRYRLREIEFYFRQPRTHNDPYVHTSREQQQCGGWYFNDADGLDLTFGDQERNTWGGILLRGLEKVPPASGDYVSQEEDTAGYIRGPRLVLRHLIAHLNGIFRQPRGIELSEIHNAAHESVQPWRVRRFGLRHKPEADADKSFLERHYRFLVDKDYLRGLKDRADIVRQLHLTPDVAKEILGYRPSA